MGKSALDVEHKTARVWSRDEIAHRILKGDIIVLHRTRVLRIPHSWLAAHPGGNLAILHFVGRDAADELEAYHAQDTITGLMSRFVAGTVELGPEGWQPFVPPSMSGWMFKVVGIEQGKEVRKWVQEAAALRSQEDSLSSPSSQILLVAKDSPSLTGSARPEDKNQHDSEINGPSLATISAPPSPLSLSEQLAHSEAYKALHEQVIAAGLYRTPYLTGYGPEIVRYLLLAASSAFLYSHGWFLLSSCCLGMLYHQLSFTVHDLGHVGVTHNWFVDRLLGIFLGDLCGGLSIGWWVDNHNVHHLVTNHPSHDPDIEHIPFFAISTHFLSSLYSSYYNRIMAMDRFAKIFLSVQHKLFYIVMALARFNLYANSYIFLAKTARARVLGRSKVRGGRWSWWCEVVALLLHWTWYGHGVLGGIVRQGAGWKIAAAYLLLGNIISSPLHVQIVLSHFSRSTADLGTSESFPHRQLRTTTDVICPDSLAFLHGGLHLQVTHHLFPRLPRHNLRAASRLVKAFAAERGLEYAEFGFREGNREVTGVLKSVADMVGKVGEQVRVVGRVAEAEVQEALVKKTVERKED